MTQAEPQKLTCDEARFFISRELDRDLDRVEIRQLFGHLSGCPECRDRLADFAVLESQISGLNQLYEKRVLSESFDKKLGAEISDVKVSDAGESKQSFPGLAAWLRQWAWVKPMVVTGVAGMFAGFLLFTALSPNNLSQVVVPEQRFFVHPITFNSADDGQKWGDEVLLPPGHTLRQIVKRGHDAPYHFRFQSQGPVNIVVTHDDTQVESDPSYRMQGPQGLRYASLHAPREGDVIVVRNDGPDTVRIDASVPVAQALEHRLDRHIKL